MSAAFTENAYPAECGYSVIDAAKRIGVCRAQLYKLMKSGKLRSIHIGRRRIIPASAVAELLSAGAPNS